MFMVQVVVWIRSGNKNFRFGSPDFMAGTAVSAIWTVVLFSNGSNLCNYFFWKMWCTNLSHWKTIQRLRLRKVRGSKFKNFRINHSRLWLFWANCCRKTLLITLLVAVLGRDGSGTARETCTSERTFRMLNKKHIEKEDENFEIQQKSVPWTVD